MLDHRRVEARAAEWLAQAVEGWLRRGRQEGKNCAAGPTDRPQGPCPHSAEADVPMAQSSWQSLGGRNSSSRCARSSGLSIGRFQPGKDIVEELLGDDLAG